MYQNYSLVDPSKTNNKLNMFQRNRETENNILGHSINYNLENEYENGQAWTQNYFPSQFQNYFKEQSQESVPIINTIKNNIKKQKIKSPNWTKDSESTKNTESDPTIKYILDSIDNLTKGKNATIGKIIIYSIPIILILIFLISIISFIKINKMSL